MAEVVRGECLGYSVQRHGFVYKYRCVRCGVKFLETCPEVSAPALCQACFSGQDAERVRRSKRDDKIS